MHARDPMTGTSAPAKPPLDLGALFPEWRTIQDDRLRTDVDALWQRLWQESRFGRLEDVPISSKIARPHLPHAQAVVRLAALVADVAEQIHAQPLDRDVLIAAALAQDVGKLVEYEPASEPPGYRRTPLGTELSHSMYAAHVALDLGLPTSVVHVMIAHSPSSALEPRTRECAVLFWIDQLDLSVLGERAWKRSLSHEHH